MPNLSSNKSKRVNNGGDGGGGVAGDGDIYRIHTFHILQNEWTKRNERMSVNNEESTKKKFPCRQIHQ